ncbi:MAG: prephenate dehydrogenase/arogenate dehydrogenase family protein [Melioribacteraceae bacterium]|nr:prephenate dehydrogenase/arogenate dehydrogenase family protein [Melioribacteraceae bacterium]
MIKNVAIIGLGLIGGSIAKALKGSKIDVNIGGFDIDTVTQKALDDKIIDEQLNAYEDIKEYELIFICLHVNLTLEVLEKFAPLLNSNQIITDVCSVKSLIQEKWDSFKSEGHYVGGHPMTGKEKGGYENSDPLLFENSIYIINENVELLERKSEFLELIKSLGCRITLLSPKEHDNAVANVSHFPQLLSVMLLNNTIKNSTETNYLDFAAGGYRDMTRIASSDYGLWEPIIQSNKEQILKVFNSFEAELASLKKMLEDDNSYSIASNFERARKGRDEVPKNTKGFLNPLYDLYVFVKDEPGVVSKISTALYQEGINIKDIELLKIREGTGGTFRLSVESQNDVERATEIINALGFTLKD